MSASKLTEKDKAICKSVLEKGWHFAIQKNVPKNAELRGMIIGDAGYIQHVTSHLEEEYMIIINKNSKEYKKYIDG